jgi:nucleoside-diphosphate-sugar epimerase
MSATKNIYITGVTGNLGAYMCAELLKQNHILYTPVRGRSNNPEYAIKRVIKAIATFGMEPAKIKNYIDQKKLNIVYADITKSDFVSRNENVPNIDDLWHFASSLKYMPKDKEQIFEANIDGLKNVINLFQAKRDNSSRFFYISTAYVLGKKLNHLPDDYLEVTEEMVFNNEYEHSKLMAEKLVLDEVNKTGINAYIFRPSIVVGDTSKGRLANFNGYYLGVKALANFKDYLQKIGKEEEVIRFDVAEQSALNLIPIDMLIDRMLKLSADKIESGKFYNITNSYNTKCRHTVISICQTVGLKVTFVDPEDFEKNPKTKFEKLIEYGFNYIMPYLRRNITFSTDNSDKLLDKPLHYEYDIEELDKLAIKYLN